MLNLHPGCRDLIRATESAEILSEPQSRIPGLPLRASSPCRTSSPSVSLINPSNTSSSDRLEQQNLHEPAEAEPGEGKRVLCTHKLTCSWGHGDSTAEPTTVPLAQLRPGCISLSQTFPRHSSGAQRLLLKGHLGANACLLEHRDFGSGSGLEAILPLAWKSWGKSSAPPHLHVHSTKIRGLPPLHGSCLV